MDIFDGASLTGRDVVELGQILGSEVVFVDFIYVLWLDSWNLATAIYRGGFLRGIDVLPINLEDVVDGSLIRWTPIHHFPSQEPLSNFAHLIHCSGC
jgi:hypothetical protein